MRGSTTKVKCLRGCDGKVLIYMYSCAVMSAMSGIQTIDPSISNGKLTFAARDCKLRAIAAHSLNPCRFTCQLLPHNASCMHGRAADAIAGISCAVLLALFFVQRFGTGRLGTAFSPVLILWFLSNGAIGLYNIAR